MTKSEEKKPPNIWWTTFVHGGHNKLDLLCGCGGHGQAPVVNMIMFTQCMCSFGTHAMIVVQFLLRFCAFCVYICEFNILENVI